MGSVVDGSMQDGVLAACTVSSGPLTASLGLLDHLILCASHGNIPVM
jgi:hypothetical protein